MYADTLDIIQGLRNLYDVIGEEKIREKALLLIESEDDLKYRKKYASLWKEKGNRVKKEHKFVAVIEDAGNGGAYVVVPFDVEQAFGKKRVKLEEDTAQEKSLCRQI